MSLGYRYDEINQALAGDCDGLALHLFGNPSRRSKKVWEWKTGDRLELTRTGKYRGWFRDWRAGKSYSPIGAAAYALGMSYEDAARWAALDYLRWPDLSGRTFSDNERAAHEKARAEAEQARQQRQSEADREAEADEARRIEQAMALWRRGVPVKGTPAEVYLRGRGIKVGAEGEADWLLTEAFARERASTTSSWPDSVRWHAGERLLLALSTAPEGDGSAVQAIHLDDAGKPVKRDDGSKIKITRGVLRGGAVKFSGAADGPVIICEGPETALSVWWATGFETWAGLGSISGVSIEAVPHARTIVVCPDDDPRGHPTIQAANKAVKRWRGEGRKVLVATPYETLKRDKSDHNDALQKHGRDYVAHRILDVLDASIECGRPKTPLDQARKALAAAVGEAMGQLTSEAIAVCREEKDGSETSQLGIRVSVGGGKTKEAIAAMVEAVARMRLEMDGNAPAIVYAVPTHRLGGELEERIEAEASAQGVPVTVRIWRGREAENPETGSTMCGNVEAVQAAQRAMLKPQEAVCRSKKGQCPFFDVCAYQAQKQETADIWLVPHAALFHQRPETIGRPAVLIVDEGIWQSSMRGFEAQRTIVGIGSIGARVRALKENHVGDLVTDPFATADLEDARRRLLAALAPLDASGNKPLPIAALLDAGVTAEICRKAGALEWKRCSPGSLRPGMDPDAFKRQAAELEAAQGDVRRMATMWSLLAEAIDSGEEASGRVSFEMVDNGQHKALVLRWTASVTEGWHAPILHIDATLRPSLVAHLFPRLKLVAEIDIATPHQHTVGVVGKSFSHLALSDEKSVRKIWKAVLLRARQTPGETLVVMPLAAEKIVRATEPVPEHVHILHHNATTGLDSFGQVSLLIVMGRTQPPPAAVSAMAGAITGKAPDAIGTADGWYQVEMATVEARDGAAVSLTRERHLPGLPEEIRAAICEDQLLQAIGRGRGVNRQADSQLEVEVWGNTEPPVAVDSFREFKAPTKDEQAMAAGLWVEAAADLATLYPALGSANAIKLDRKRLGSNSNSISNWKVTPTSPDREDAGQRLGTNSNKDDAAAGEMTELAQRFLRSAPHLRLAAYRKAGPGTRPGVAIWDPRTCPDPKSTLVAALGELAVWAEIRWPAADETAPETEPTAPEPVPKPLPAPQEPVSAGVGYGSGGYGVGVYRGSVAAPEGILTPSQNVSSASQAGVSGRLMVPKRLLREASPVILNAGFRRAPPPAWLMGSRR